MNILFISLLVAIIFYLLNNKTEEFTQHQPIAIKQCNYNDKSLTKRCKEIRDGCASLVKEEEKMKNTLAKGCDLNKDANTSRETLSNRRDCVTGVERLIRTKYAKKELCSQIKNMPTLPSKAKKTSDQVVVKIPEVLPYTKGAYSDAKF